MIKDIVFYSVDFRPSKNSGFIDVQIFNRLKGAIVFVNALKVDGCPCRINRHYREFDLSNNGTDTCVDFHGDW